MGKPVEIKTKQNEASVKEFIENVADEQKRRDSLVVLDLMKNATGEDPRMWGSSIIGFGSHRYKSPTTGREVEWFVIGFSPRKANLSLYFLDIKSHAATLEKLGRHKTGSGCLYINKLDDIDIEVLRTIIQASTRNK